MIAFQAALQILTGEEHYNCFYIADIYLDRSKSPAFLETCV